MTWVHVALAVLVTIIVLVIAVSRSYALGRESGERDTLAGQGSDSGSLFGTDVPVREAEQGLIDVMPSEVIVCDGNGSVRCSSKSPVNVDVIENGWIVKDEILDILHVVVENGGVREREMRVSLDLTRMSSAISGRGVTAGSSAPSDSYLRVRVGHICDGLYAVFINDVTEQRRFEQMRRDFVTNVSHELKTPAGAISLLAETVSDAADDPGAVRYFAGRITKESARLAELVTHLIELQRAQDAPAMLKAQRISAMSVVRAAVGENLVQAGAKHIAIRLSLCGEQAPVDADAAADDEAQRDIAIMVDRETLTMAVKNLVENAIRYSPEYTTVSVSVSLCKDPSSMTIRVIDQGIGIPRRRWTAYSNGSTGSIRRGRGPRAARGLAWPSPSIACRSAAARSPYGRARAKAPRSPSSCRWHPNRMTMTASGRMTAKRPARPSARREAATPRRRSRPAATVSPARRATHRETRGKAT